MKWVADKLISPLLFILLATFPASLAAQPTSANSHLESAMKDKACNLESGGSCGLPTSEEELRKILSPEQYHIVRESGTERPFQNAFWDNHRAGIYVDVISGEPLFSSLDKFDSGTGWPSFMRPLEPSSVLEKHDVSHGMTRTEVRSKQADSHLGHLFPDGPAPSGMRYCINSASLRFIPVEELEAKGYGRYRALFAEKK